MIKLTEEQQKVFDSANVYNYVLGERRWGKTTLLLYAMHEEVTTNKFDYYFFSPNYDMSQYAMRQYLEVFGEGAMVQGNLVILPNGSKLHFCSSMNGDKKIKELFDGTNKIGLCFDDSEFMPTNFVSNVIKMNRDRLVKVWECKAVKEFRDEEGRVNLWSFGDVDNE